MGTAILRGLLAKPKENADPSLNYTAWVRSQTSLQRLRDDLGDLQTQVNCIGGEPIVDSISSADVVILGFPPGELDAVLATKGLIDVLRGKLIISLLAGVSCDRLASGLQLDRVTAQNASIFRVIPSLGAKINDSVTLIAEPVQAGQDGQKVTGWMFMQLGEVQWLPESLMDEGTATGAACNALIMIAVDAIVDASVAEGLPRPAATKLAVASLRSASGLLMNGGMTPESLKESMSVSRGITINAVLELERGHVRSAISDGVRHAIRYTRDM